MNSSQNPQEPPCPKPDSEIVINFRHLSIQFLNFRLPLLDGLSRLPSQIGIHFHHIGFKVGVIYLIR